LDLSNKIDELVFLMNYLWTLLD